MLIQKDTKPEMAAFFTLKCLRALLIQKDTKQNEAAATERAV